MLAEHAGQGGTRASTSIEGVRVGAAESVVEGRSSEVGQEGNFHPRDRRPKRFLNL